MTDRWSVCWRDGTALRQTDGVCVGETILPYDRQMQCVLARQYCLMTDRWSVCWRDNTALRQTDEVCVGETMPLLTACSRLHSIDFPVSGCQRSCLPQSLLFLLQRCRIDREKKTAKPWKPTKINRAEMGDIQSRKY